MASKYSDDNIVVRHARMAVKSELKKKQALNQPVAKFDIETNTIYMMKSDGTRVVVGNANRGRYSDRVR